MVTTIYDPMPLPSTAYFRVESCDVRQQRAWDFESPVLITYRLRFFYPEIARGF